MSLTVKRDSGNYSMLRKFKILVDGNSIGEIARNETITFAVPSGMHTVSVKIDWVETNRISFNFDSGDKAILIGTNFKLKEEMKPRLSWNPFKSISNAFKDVGNMMSGKTSSGEAAIYIKDISPIAEEVINQERS